MRIERTPQPQHGLVSIAALVVCLLGTFSRAGPGTPQTNGDAARAGQLTELQEEKLRHEIRKLRTESEKADSPWHLLLSNSAFIAAMAAVFGAVLTLWKQINETAKQRQQRELESRRNLDKRFTSIVANLASDSPAIRVSAAVSALTFLRPEYEVFHDQVYLMLLANLKVGHDNVVGRLLVQAFGEAARVQFQNGRLKGILKLDLSRAYLNRVDLSSIDMSGADFYQAEMSEADFTGAKLFRTLGGRTTFERARFSRAKMIEARMQGAKAQQAQFHNAILHEANFKEADLRRAQFQRAELQSVHFDNAQLEGARFEQADLAGTFFLGAKLDDAALRSIVIAKHWEKARFDADDMIRLKRLSEQKERKTKK